MARRLRRARYGGARACPRLDATLRRPRATRLRFFCGVVFPGGRVPVSVLCVLPSKLCVCTLISVLPSRRPRPRQRRHSRTAPLNNDRRDERHPQKFQSRREPRRLARRPTKIPEVRAGRARDDVRDASQFFAPHLDRTTRFQEAPEFQPRSSWALYPSRALRPRPAPRLTGHARRTVLGAEFLGGRDRTHRASSTNTSHASPSSNSRPICLCYKVHQRSRLRNPWTCRRPCT